MRGGVAFHRPSEKYFIPTGRMPRGLP